MVNEIDNQNSAINNSQLDGGLYVRVTGCIFYVLWNWQTEIMNLYSSN